MENTVENLILLSKQMHIDELNRLAFSTSFVETIGMIIHQLQVERGASCLHLASGGQRFSRELVEIVTQNRQLDERFKHALDAHLANNASPGAKQLTLISWVLLGFDEIKALRQQVTLLKIPFASCIKSYSRMVNSLISLLFEITDSTVDTALSKHLVALYNWVQAKEYAGQERAVGAFILGSGTLQAEHQQRLNDLIELQDRHVETFCQFATPEELEAWNALLNSQNTASLHHFRALLLTAVEHQALDVHHASEWFDVCSVRITEFWKVQCHMVETIHQALDQLTIKAQKELKETRRYLDKLRQNQQALHEKSLTFFDLTIPVEQSLSFFSDETINPYPIESIVSLLHHQTQQIADIENELSKTKKALNERKVIERAKGLVMQRFAISEEEAYKYLRSTAMSQNRKIIEVAENILEINPSSRQ